MKKLSLFFCLFLGMILLSSCGNTTKNIDTVKTIQERGKLVVATSADYPPFEFQMMKNGKNEIVGSDIDLAQAIADKLGVELEVHSMNFNTVLLAMVAGKADMAISGISPTPERAKSYNFSKLYYTSENKIIVRKKDLAKYNSIESFTGLQIGAQKGSIQEDLVHQKLPKSEEVGLGTIGSIILQVQSGKLAGMVIEGAIGESYLETNPDLAFADVTLPNDDGEGSAICLMKGNDELTEATNKIIDELQKSGQIDKMIAKNFELANAGNEGE